MKSFSKPAPATKTLNQLVSLLASDASSIAVRRRSSIVNDVPKALPIVIDENAMAEAVGRLVSYCDQSHSRWVYHGKKRMNNKL